MHSERGPGRQHMTADERQWPNSAMRKVYAGLLRCRKAATGFGRQLV